MTDFITVPRDGVNLRVYDLGGEGEPVLFSHAASFCGLMWSPIVERLKSDFRCFIVDMRGHGASIPLDPKAMRWDLMAADLVAIVEHIRAITGLTQGIHGIGHSMGGTCLLMAEVANPGILKSVWAYEPILFSTGATERAEVTQMLYEGTLRRKPSFESREVARERFRSKPPMDEFADEVLDSFISYGLHDESGRAWLSCTPEVEAEVYLGAGTGVTTTLSDITFPAKFVVGQNDGDRVPAILGFAEATGIQVETLEDLGHFGPFVSPSMVAPSVVDWLGNKAN